MRILLLVLALGFAGCAAVVETASSNAPNFSEARAVCRAVAEGRAEFLDVAQGYEQRDEDEWTSVDVDNDGTPEDIAILAGGTSGTPYIVQRGRPYDAFNSRYEDVDHNFGPWSGQLQLTRVNGRVYEVFYSDSDSRDYPVYVAIHLQGGEGRWLCAFQSAAPAPRLRPLRSDVAQLCAAVEQRDIADYAPMSLEDTHVSGDYFTRPAGAVDFMNDGRPRELVKVLRAWGGGSGCDTEYYALADGFSPYAERDWRPEAVALAGLQNSGTIPIPIANGYGVCHGNVARFHNIDGSVVFEQRFPGQRPQLHDQEFWWVSRIENGQAVRLCEARAFEPRPRAIEYNRILYPQSR